MATSYLTPNMSLVIPTVGVQIGPDWANNVNASLTILDSHNHNLGNGVQISPTGLNINADLPFGMNNATMLRSVRFTSQSAALSNPADIGCIYDVLGDLFYNDGSANQIRITQSGSVVGSPGTITGLPSGTASASFQSISGTFKFEQATGTAANLDAGSLIVRYPGSYPVPSGNAIVIEAPSSLASLYSITLPALPGSTSFLTMDTSGVMGATVSTVQGITNAMIAPVNASTGSFVTNFNTTSSAFVFTGLGNAITTIGKPVMILISSDTTGAVASFRAAAAASEQTVFDIVILRDGVLPIMSCSMGENLTTGTAYAESIFPAAGMSCLDLTVPAGAHTYQLDIRCNGATYVEINNAQLLTYELK